jgi:hypothetical protein
MQPDRVGFWPVKKEGRGRFLRVGAQRFPRIALRENVVQQAFRHKAAVGFLRHRENDFHDGNMALPWKNDKSALAEIKREFLEMARNSFGEI